METLTTALNLLKDKFGEFDDIKLLLSDAPGMTQESVAAELLCLGEQLKSGQIEPDSCLNEEALTGYTIAV